MFCSVIIPTIGRESLTRAVNSVLQQEFTGAPVEVIVVNDSGSPLAAAAWQYAKSVRLVQTQRRDRSVARNAGAAVARGAYLCFLDDDDWWLPGALTEFWQLAQQAPSAAWLYGGVQFVDPAGAPLGKLHLGKSGNCFVEVMSAVWIPLQASLIRADAFFAAGGFDATLNVTEDLDLCRRMALHADFACIPATVTAVLRGDTWASSTPPDQVAGASRLGRERLLGNPGSWRRLQDSAADSAFYAGRVLHTYGSACLLAARQKRYMTAFSRFAFGGLSLLRAGPHLLQRPYWQALRTHTLTHTFVTEASPAYRSVSEWLY